MQRGRLLPDCPGIAPEYDGSRESKQCPKVDWLAASASGYDPCGRIPDVLRSAMTEKAHPAPALDRDLIALLDHALGMVADHLTPHQRADLWQRSEKMGLRASIERQCSPEVQRVLLSEQP